MSTITENRSADLALLPHDRALPADIWRARSYIDQHLEEEISLAKVASFAGISPNHLSEKFKEVNGVKFVDYVAHARFERARVLLPDRELRISEIAFEVGFQSLSQFNRVFKKLSGKSPTEYRTSECMTTDPTPDGSNGCKPTTTSVNADPSAVVKRFLSSGDRQMQPFHNSPRTNRNGTLPLAQKQTAKERHK